MGSSELREVDLERGMPRADQALKQLTFELRRSRSLGAKGLSGGILGAKGGHLISRLRRQLPLKGKPLGEF